MQPCRSASHFSIMWNAFVLASSRVCNEHTPFDRFHSFGRFRSFDHASIKIQPRFDHLHGFAHVRIHDCASLSLRRDNWRSNSWCTLRGRLTLLYRDRWYLRLLALVNAVMVFGCATLGAPCANSGDICLEALLFCTICPRSQLHKRVQWHLHPGRLRLWEVHEVGIYTANDGLVARDCQYHKTSSH
jgi:hypothetical protein